MPKVLKSQYKDDLSYVIDYFVEKEVYTPWKDRLFDQILSTVEVPGFRKGKAPRHLALQQVNPLAVEDTILREAIAKFGNDAAIEGRKVLKEDGRVIQAQNADFDPEAMAKDDGSFQFQIIFSLLPKIDLSVLEKLKEPKITDKDLPERLSTEDFVAREKANFLNTFNEYEKSDTKIAENSHVVVDVLEEVKDQEPKDLKGVAYSLGIKQLPPDFEANLVGLKTGESKKFSLKLAMPNTTKTVDAKYNITIKEVLQPKYTDIQSLIENSEEAKKQFPSEKDFTEFLTKYYDQETGAIVEDVKRRKIIQEAIKIIPDFPLPADKLEAEQNRILEVLQSQTEQTGETLGQAWSATGLGETKDKVLDDALTIKKEIDGYVHKEFKWVYILRSIYEAKIEPKITEDEVHELVHDMEKRPNEYQISKGLSHEQLDELAFDKLMRSKSATWLFNLVLPKVKEEK